MKIAPSSQPGEWMVRPADAVTAARPEVIAPPPAPQAPTPDKEALDEETRAGILRLMRKVKKSAKDSKENPREKKNRRKLDAYRFHGDRVEPEVQRGQLLDKSR